MACKSGPENLVENVQINKALTSQDRVQENPYDEEDMDIEVVGNHKGNLGKYFISQ